MAKRKIKVRDENGKIKKVDPEKLADGPILHTSLDDDLLLRIKVIFDEFKPYLKNTLASTLEQFEMGFMRDLHPEAEVELWEDILITFNIAKEMYKNDDKMNAQIYDCLIMNSLGAFTPKEEKTEFVAQMKSLYSRVVKTRRSLPDPPEE